MKEGSSLKLSNTNKIQTVGKYASTFLICTQLLGIVAPSATALADTNNPSEMNANSTQVNNSTPIDNVTFPTRFPNNPSVVKTFKYINAQGETLKLVNVFAHVGDSIDLNSMLPPSNGQNMVIESAHSQFNIVNSPGNTNNPNIAQQNPIIVIVKSNDVSNQNGTSTSSNNSSQSNNATEDQTSNSTSVDSNTSNKQDSVSTNNNQSDSQSNEENSNTNTPSEVQLPSTATNTDGSSRDNVVNPMLRPDNNADQISNAAEFNSNVPFDYDSDYVRDFSKIKEYKGFDKTVLRWKPYLAKVTKYYKMSKYNDLFLAIMENESHGLSEKTPDIMQSSESAGLSPNSLKPEQSIEQAVRYMKAIVEHAKDLDKSEHQNPMLSKNQYHDYATDKRLLAQTYAFGGNFLDYINKQKNGYTLKNTENYSKNVIAPLLGNTAGTKYKYSNEISRMYHKEYLYTNGGNFFYGDLVERYMVNNFMRKILKNLIQYNGDEYVFGGHNPQTGFDCSGFTSYGLSLVNCTLPAYTVSQFNMTKKVSRLNKAKPGDLIFFKGTYGAPDFIAHVEFIIDRHTMFGANGSGIGFHNIDELYWKNHYAGVRRVKNSKQLNLIAKMEFENDVKNAVSEYSNKF